MDFIIFLLLSIALLIASIAVLIFITYVLIVEIHDYKRRHKND